MKLHQIKQKLNSNDGVSVLIALVVFLVAAMVSAVIVVSAVTAMKNLNEGKERQQSRLLVQSASQLVAEELQNVSCKVKNTTPNAEFPVYTCVIDQDTHLKEELETAIEWLVNNGPASIQDYDSALRGTGLSIHMENQQQVLVEFVVKNGNHSGDESQQNYQFTATLTTEDKDVSMHVSAGASVIENVSENSTTITWTTVHFAED